MNILITYVNVGGGFKSPAIAISKELKNQGATVKTSDFLAEIKEPKIDFFYKNSWKKLAQQPNLFNIVYHITNILPRSIEKLITSKLEKKTLYYLQKEKPDVIISSYFLLTYLFTQVIKKYRLSIKLYAYNPDVLTAHKYWINNDVERYFISSDEGYNEMICRGQKKEILKKTSFPLDEKFKKKFSDIKEERSKLKLQECFTATIMLGGDSTGNLEATIDALITKNVQVIAICGRDKTLYNKLTKKYAKNKKVHIKGFVTNMQDFVYCSDVVIGKSGLNFVFESMYLKKPFLCTVAIGPERSALAYIKKHKVGFECKTNEALLKKMQFLQNKKNYNSILKNINNLTITFNTKEIAEEILK